MGVCSVVFNTHTYEIQSNLHFFYFRRTDRSSGEKSENGIKFYLIIHNYTGVLVYFPLLLMTVSNPLTDYL